MIGQSAALSTLVAIEYPNLTLSTQSCEVVRQPLVVWMLGCSQVMFESHRILRRQIGAVKPQPRYNASSPPPCCAWKWVHRHNDGIFYIS